jgi:hypothetical protein
MRKEAEMTKHNFVDLADQPAAPQVLLVTVNHTYNGATTSHQAAFRVDEVTQDPDTLDTIGVRAGKTVVAFSQDFPWMLVDSVYLETYTVAEAREAVRQDIVDRVHVAKDQQRIYEAAQGGQSLPDLYTHETLQPESGPESQPDSDEKRGPKKPFDINKWFSGQFGDEETK